MTTFEGTPLIFADNDYAFMNHELGLSREVIDALDEDGLSDLYDKLCEIEIDETIKHLDDELSERGEMAVHLIDVIHGPYDSTEFDAEMADNDG
jgi:hypothetical protein